MNLGLITDKTHRRYRSYVGYAPLPKAFYQAIKGINFLNGKKVLEIGATTDLNLHDFVVGHCGYYDTVGFEAENVPGYVSRDFFSMSEEKKYDLVISNRVFERDSTLVFPMWGWRSVGVGDVLEKFNGLLVNEGWVVARTFKKRSMFSREQVEQAGFNYQQDSNEEITLMQRGKL